MGKNFAALKSQGFRDLVRTIIVRIRMLLLETFEALKLRF